MAANAVGVYLPPRRGRAVRVPLPLPLPVLDDVLETEGLDMPLDPPRGLAERDPPLPPPLDVAAAPRELLPPEVHAPPALLDGPLAVDRGPLYPRPAITRPPP